MRDALREVRPTEFADLVALVALYRPGPMAFIPTYAKNKRDPSRVRFADPRLEPITGPTYSVAVYQEQLMQISRALAGFSPARADDLRKAVGKKDKELMASLRDEFVQGCIDSGTDPNVAEDLWGLCEAAGDYSFNKSHAACYALLAYRTAYLKANHPAEYMAAVLTSVMDTKDRVPFYVSASSDMGLEVLPPDVNKSESGFAVTGESEIRFGLTAVKGVGENAVHALIEERTASGPYTTIWDPCPRPWRRRPSGAATRPPARSRCSACWRIPVQGRWRPTRPSPCPRWTRTSCWPGRRRPSACTCRAIRSPTAGGSCGA
jgi:DNA polymerase-3 subunit alpha